LHWQGNGPCVETLGVVALKARRALRSERRTAPAREKGSEDGSALPPAGVLFTQPEKPRHFLRAARRLWLPTGNVRYLGVNPFSRNAACAAASRAIGTRNGEQET